MLYALEKLFYATESNEDDNEEGDSKRLKHDAKNKPINIAIFVVRMCGPYQIGPNRFKCITKVAEEAIQRVRDT